MEDPEAKDSPNIKRLIDLSVGGEGREDLKKKSVGDARKRKLSDLGRSDCCSFLLRNDRMKLTQRQKSAGS